jgi:DNA ligase-associated metallophosphoesterase
VSAAPIHIAGERLMLDPAGVLFWPARRMLVVADLHLEKGSSFAARGHGLLPPYDTRETLQNLGNALRRYRPDRLVALGDSFHDAAGHTRLAEADAATLRHMLNGVAITWVLGNHDPVAPASLPGEACDELRDGPLVFRHQALPGKQPPGELSGHFHPKGSMPTRCGPVTRPCFMTDPRRVILPAFGAYTGGLAATDPALANLFPWGSRLFLLGKERLFSLPMPPARRLTTA